MIVKCSNCQQMLAEKDFDLHECDIQLKGCRVIEVTSFYDGSYNGQRIMNGQGTDGILYSFRIVPRKAILLMQPLSRRKVTDLDDSREGNRTLLDKAFIFGMGLLHINRNGQ